METLLGKLGKLQQTVPVRISVVRVLRWHCHHIRSQVPDLCVVYRRRDLLLFMFRHGKPHLLSPMTDHYNLSLWITSTIGLAKLAAQFYFYQFNIVHI